MEKERWIEIQFAYLCFDLYAQLRNYVNVTYYIELLADMRNVDKSKALRLLQKVNQINAIRPTRSEYVTLAKKHKQSNAQICKTLKISKQTLADLKVEPITEFYIHSTPQEIQDMETLLKAHNTLKGCGL